MSGNVWFITGASSGFGKAIALEALSRGDSVIASSRRAASSPDPELLAAGVTLLLDLDVTSPDAAIEAALARAEAAAGGRRVTHFVNAPGYILVGAVEEVSAREALDSLTTNVLGVMNMTRHEVAYLRQQQSGKAREGEEEEEDGKGEEKRGVIANFGSVGSWYGGPAYSHYAAAKWAVSGFTESLHEEARDLGLRALVVEPGYFRTGFLNPGGGNRRFAGRDLSAEYAGTGVQEVKGMLDRYDNRQPGDVAKGARVIVDVLTGAGVAAGREFPMRLILGRDCLEDIRAKIKRTEAIIADWEDVITSTDHDDVEKA